MDELRPNLNLLGLRDDHHHLHHHHHEKRIPKTEAPDFAALYGLSNSVIENQQPSTLPSSSHLTTDHSSKFKYFSVSIFNILTMKRLKIIYYFPSTFFSIIYENMKGF